MKRYYMFIACIIAIIIVALIFSSVTVAHKAEITKWVESRGEYVEQIEYRSLSVGPFWYSKNSFTYYIKSNKHIYYVRYGFTTKAYIQIADNHYEQVEFKP